MDWTNHTVMQFLELYQMHPCIWNPKNASHKNKTKVNDAWIDIKNNMGEPCTVKELKKKRESLMSAFRGYKTKIKKSETSGAGTSNVYQPIWFAYEVMNSFLGSIYKYNPSNTEDNQNQFVQNSNTDQDDAGDTNTVIETDVSSPQEDSKSRVPQHSFKNQRSLSSQQTSTATASKRKHHNLPELQQAKKQMDQAFHILKTVAQPKDCDEDECSIFGKLIAKKLRKLTEDRRDLMMIKINQVIFDERQEYNRENSSSSMASYPYISSPIQIFYENNGSTEREESDN